jgi:hypothetical protein
VEKKGPFNLQKMNVHKLSAFALLQSILDNNSYGETMMVLVFHLSHLLLRLLILPNNYENFIVFSRLHSHQTSMLILRCSHLMDFEDWFVYIKALSDDRGIKSITLLELISKKLDLGIKGDYRRAQDAIQTIIEGDQFESDDFDGEYDANHVFTKSYLSEKIQYAFCQSAFTQSQEPVSEAVQALNLGSQTKYLDTLGYHLV